MADRVDNQFDIAILGAGTSGYLAAIRAGQLGLKAAVVEKDRVGGVCLCHGCIPTEVLLYATTACSLLLHGEGLSAGARSAVFDYARAAYERRKRLDHLDNGVETLLRDHKVATVKGTGTLLSPNSISVRIPEQSVTVEIHANHVIIATGSRPLHLPGLRPDGRRMLSSDQSLELASIPRSVTIVGAGKTGVGLAGVYAEFGANVTLVEKASTILPTEDAKLREPIERLFVEKGIRMVTANEVSREDVRYVDGEVRLATKCADEIGAHKLLVALGRTGNTENIGLDKVGIQRAGGFIIVDGDQHTGTAGVYAIGGVTGATLSVNDAAIQGIYVVERIAGLNPKRTHVPYESSQLCRGPSIVGVGICEEQARARGFNVRVGQLPLGKNQVALGHDSPDGLIRCVADDDSGCVLGVSLVTPESTERFPELSMTKLLQASADRIILDFDAHPALAEVMAGLALRPISPSS